MAEHFSPCYRRDRYDVRNGAEDLVEVKVIDKTIFNFLNNVLL